MLIFDRLPSNREVLGVANVGWLCRQVFWRAGMLNDAALTQVQVLRTMPFDELLDLQDAIMKRRDQVDEVTLTLAFRMMKMRTSAEREFSIQFVVAHFGEPDCWRHDETDTCLYYVFSEVVWLIELRGGTYFSCGTVSLENFVGFRDSLDKWQPGESRDILSR